MAGEETRSVEVTSNEERGRAHERDRDGSPDSADTSVPEEWVRVAAYYVAERRGFAPGHELEDWLVAETSVRATCGAPAPKRAGRTHEEVRGGEGESDDRSRSEIAATAH